jgi:subtilisin family serine protease
MNRAWIGVVAAMALPLSMLTAWPATAADGAPPPARLTPGVGAPASPGQELARGVIVRTTGAAALATARSGVSELPVDVKVVRSRSIAVSTDVLLFDRLIPLDQAEEVAAALQDQRGVIWAEPDVRVHLTSTPAIPNDPFFPQLTGMWDGGGARDFSIKAPLAWNKQVGQPNVVVAVLDTGITRHPDLDSNLVSGYDFVSDVPGANDGDGWDPDPSDPGDWITLGESAMPFGPFDGCQVGASSWHGTHVAGTVAAIQNDSFGVTGVSPGVRLQTVRVLGKCGGFLSDVAAGITWASGGSVPGAPANPTPAKVLNLSLGSDGSCPAAYSSAISGAISRGATVVVAAGNEDEPMTVKSPVSCPGVVAVTATDINGQRTLYSNYGVSAGQATIAAPGGDVSAPGDRDKGILSTINPGTTSPVYDGNWYLAYRQGTSMAAPHVAGAAALLYSVGHTSATRVRELLVSAVQPFPAYGNRWDCTVIACGAGILDLSRMDLSPPVPDAPISVSATPGDRSATVTWQAPASDGGSPITGYTATASPGGATCTTTGALTCQVLGLTNGTAYTFTVRASNTNGMSVASAASAAVTPRSVPSAPSGVTGLFGDRAVTVSWQAPASDGGSPITGYSATASPGGATCTTTGALTCLVSGLTNGTAYTFTVQATNVVGTSAASVASAPVTPRTTPDAPRAVTGRPGDQSVTVSWQAPASDGGSPITGYSATAAPGGATCTTSGALTCVISGLGNGTAYTFAVTATNAVGTSPVSVESPPVSPRVPPSLPGAVSGFKLGKFTKRGPAYEVVIRWRPPVSSGGAPVIGYQGRLGTRGAWSELNQSGARLTQLRPGTRFVFQVRAVNEAGPGAVATYRLTTPRR